MVEDFLTGKKLCKYFINGINQIPSYILTFFNGRVSCDIQPKKQFSAWVLACCFFLLNFKRNPGESIRCKGFRLKLSRNNQYSIGNTSKLTQKIAPSTDF